MQYKDYTLVCVLKPDQILLGLKKRGFGTGKWNGFGGKVEANETIEQAAIRELHEECSLTCTEEHLNKVGKIRFVIHEPQMDFHMHVFVVEKYSGEPIESDEMAPKWFRLADIPYEKMWHESVIWFPHMLYVSRLKDV